MKTIRFLTWILIILLCASALSVSAAPAREQTLSITVDDALSLDRDSSDPAFWEFPMLAPGQTLSDGTLTIRNTSDYTAEITLKRVDLPYDNRDVLTYLNAVTLILRLDEQEIFHDRFVKLAEFDYDFGTLGSDESLTLTVEMRCDFAYAGEVTAVKDPVTWQFDVHTDDEVKANGDPVMPNTRIPIQIIWMGGAAIVLVVICLLVKYLPRRKNSDAKN